MIANHRKTGFRVVKLKSEWLLVWSDWMWTMVTLTMWPVCRNLLPCDSDNLADPYVKMYLLPDKSSSGKRKTQVVKNNLDPVFDET